LIKLTYQDFLKTVNANAGEVLITSGGKALFCVETDKHGVVFIPRSTNKPRSDRAENIERCIEIFNQSQSDKTADYQEKTRNGSYILSVIKLCMGQHPDAPLIDDGTSATGNIDPEFTAPEGEIKVRAHRHRERSRELVQMAKQVFKEKHGKLYCVVCTFDFGKIYDEPDFIEAHHRVPLCELEPGTITKISDLAMVCANCHRMLHRGNPWPTIEQLKQKIQSTKLRSRN
jgi:hypothetical protein